MSRANNYCSADTDVRALLKHVTDTVFADASIEYFIERTDDYIDARLAQLYTVPFTTTPPMVRTISAHLSAYYVLRTLYVQARTTNTDAWMESFKTFGMDSLNDIINGNIMLLDSSGNIISRKHTRGMKSSTEDFTPVFNEQDETTWQVDSNKT